MKNIQKPISTPAFVAFTLLVTLLMWLAQSGHRIYSHQMSLPEAIFILTRMFAAIIILHFIFWLADRPSPLPKPPH
jgi:hypothetical protein